jgi:hypothetical protein
MALPQVDPIESKLTDVMKDVFDRTTNIITQNFMRISDSITDSLSRGIKQITGYRVLDLSDLLTFSFSNTIFDKISNKFSSLFGRGESSTKLEELVADQTDQTVEQLLDLNKSFTKFIKNQEWDQEKDDFEDSDQTPPAPAIPVAENKMSFSAIFGTLFKDLIKLAMRAVPIALVGGAIAASMISGVKEWDIGEKIGSALGLGKDVGGLVNLLIGNAQEGLLNKFARYGTYAAAGAAIGAVGLLPGIVAGGIIGLITGIVFDVVSGWIGKDKIYQFVDKLTDSFWTGLEYITGTDVNRLEKRIKELTAGKGNIEEMIVQKHKDINELESKIAKARDSGKSIELQKLTKLLDTTKSELTDLEKSSSDYDKRISDMKIEINDAKKTFWDKSGDFIKTASWYILSIPARLIDTITDVFTGKGNEEQLSEWTRSTKDTVIQSKILNFERTIGKAVGDLVWKIVDQVSDFFMKDLPKAFDDIGNMLKKTLSDAYNELVDLASTIAKEISFRDFLPETLGGNTEGLFDRVQRILNDKEKQIQSDHDKNSDVPGSDQLRDNIQSPIRENTTSRDNISEGLRHSIMNVQNDNSKSSSTLNAPIVTQNNVSHRNMTTAPNYAKNVDPTSRLMDLANSGVVVLP